MLKKKGYSFYSSLSSTKRVDDFFTTFCELLNFINSDNSKYSNFDSKKLSKKILFLKKKKPEKIKFLYNTLNHTSSFINLFELNSIRTKAAKILSCPKNNLIICEHQFRIDYPKDSKHTLKPHQDISFYPQDLNGSSGLVCNISLHNITSEMGSAIIYPYSHSKGKMNFLKKRNTSDSSGQRSIKKLFFQEFKKKIIETKKSDVIFYHMNLIHSSGLNISNKVRYSAIARIFNPHGSSFRKFEKQTKLI